MSDLSTIVRQTTPRAGKSFAAVMSEKERFSGRVRR